MRYLILPIVAVLAYLAAGKDTSAPTPAAVPATAELAAAPEAPAAKEPRRTERIEVDELPMPNRALIDDTQRPAPHPALHAQGLVPGRFWLETLPNNYFILVDTHTGRCWQRALTDQKWKDLASPAEQ